MTTTPEQLADVQHPWIGLASFTEGDSEFFAGRGEEIDELLRLVHRDTLTLLYGVSGLGKTSLLQAGIFPAVRSGDWLPVAIRLDYSESAQTLAAQVLAAISTKASAAGVETPQSRPGETLWEYFHREDNHFWSPRNDLVTPFLVFDQFEEAFTLGRENPTRVRRFLEFISEFADLVENRPPAKLRDDPQRAREFSFKPARLRVLLAMREDYIAELDGLRSQFRALDQNRLRLLPMGAPQARQVIELGAPLLAPGVADRIVAFTAGNAAAAAGDEIAVAPALLSLVLRELNERRLAQGPDEKITPDLLAVEHQKILEDFYLRTLHGFPVGVRSFVEDELLTATGYRNSCALDDALSKPDVTQPFLDELVNRRLLAYEDRHHARRVEITHDILAPVIKTSRDTRLAREAVEEAKRKQDEARKKEVAAREQVEAREKQRATKQWMTVVLVLLGLTVAGAVWAFLQSSSATNASKHAEEAQKHAETEKTKAEKALVDSFLRTIGGEKIGDKKDFLPSYGEREALWDLSKEPRQVRAQVIDSWMRGADSMKRALAYDARGLHAAIGLGDYFASKKAKDAAEVLVRALQDPQQTDPDRLTNLGDALVTLAPRLDKDDAGALAETLKRQETDPYRLSSMGIALAALATRSSSAEAVDVDLAARRLAELINPKKTTDAYALSNLGNALAALKASDGKAGSAAETLADVLEKNPETDLYELWKLGGALAALAARLETEQAAYVSGRGATKLANALKNPQATDSGQLWCLGDALAALAARLNADDAKKVTGDLAKVLTDTKAELETDPARLASLGDAFAPLAVHLEPAAANALAENVANALKDPKETDPNRLSSLGTALAALTVHLPDAAAVAGPGATCLMSKMDPPKEVDQDQLAKLGTALAALAARMPSAEAAAVAKPGATALAERLLKDPKETDPNRLLRLGDALAALGAFLDPAEAESVADSLASALRGETDPNRLASLSTALAALAARSSSPAALAGPAATQLADVLKPPPTPTDSEKPQVTDSSRLWRLGNALTALAAQTRLTSHDQLLLGLENLFLNEVLLPPRAGKEEDPTRKTIAKACALLTSDELTEVLKWPFCVGQAQKLVLTELEKKMKVTFDGDLGKFIEQVGIKNLDGRAHRPSAPYKED